MDREAPELSDHLAVCPECRARAEAIRADIGLVDGDFPLFTVPVPERIGPYAVTRLLGEGGQAFVYEAEQPAPRRAVALKVLKGGRFASESHVRHFRREMQSLAALNHPGIATIFDAGRTEEGQYYFAMELVQGSPLGEYLEQERPARRERLALFRSICRAVQYAHEYGVIHRDQRPTNIMVGHDGRPKILDFGLARISGNRPGGSSRATETIHVGGTPRYMSPEQVLGETGRIDVRTDVYSLGVMLYEILTGRVPYRTGGAFTPATVQAICKELPPRPGSLDRSLRGDLETIVLTALEKDPTQRYPSVRTLVEDLDRFLDRRPILAQPVSWIRTARARLARPRTAAAGMQP